MKAIRYIGLLLMLGLVAACSAQRTMVLSPLPASQQSGSLVAQFGARLTIAGQSEPVQGEVQMTEACGSIALILPHGRTLGVCTYSPDVPSGSGAKGAAGAQPVKMQCTPAEGMGREAASLLFRTGVAIYRILPALGQDAVLNLEGKGWKARFSPTDDGLNGIYSEQDGMAIDMYFVEISHL